MKLDAIFAPMRSESVDDMKTEIKIRGMGDIKLKPQVISKSSVDRNKLDEVHEQRRAARQQIAMPDKPAKFKRLKPKPKPKEPSPIKDPSPINEEPQQVTPSKDLINDQHDEPEEIVEIVENIMEDENPEFLLEESEELSVEEINERLKTIYIYMYIHIYIYTVQLSIINIKYSGFLSYLQPIYPSYFILKPKASRSINKFLCAKVIYKAFTSAFHRYQRV